MRSIQEEKEANVLEMATLVGGALYVGYAGVVACRQRASSYCRIETAETSYWLQHTPPFCHFAAVLVPAMPLIADMTCAVNGLLWPVELVTRPLRYRLSGQRGGQR